jgi:DNA-binding winged helix-turn-helix (wHTH) protein/tetratricopeptide (TPR) repeat protein
MLGERAGELPGTMTRAELHRIPAPPIRFPPFVLDPEERRLSSGVDPLPIRQRALDVLLYLASRPGRLVTKHELLSAVWSGVSVSEIVLTVCVSELRKILGDAARAPRIIETVHGRGYRFIASLGADEPGVLETCRPGGLPPHHRVVGRSEELQRLDQLLDRALAGQRQMVFVTGEPGIGKTTLVDEFLGRAAVRGAFRLVRGQCVEQRGVGEPFMPVLEGLGRLCHESGDPFVQQLRTHAPSWLLQLPGLIPPADEETLHRQYAGVTRVRMLREMVVGVESLTTSMPMVLVLEDLHWSDPSTVELLVALAHQRGTAHLLVVGTYRPLEASTDSHLLDAIGRIVDDPASCTEVALEPLTESAVEEYLAGHLGGIALPAGLPRALHRRTGGNPLFMVHVAPRLAAALRSAGGGEAPALPDLSTLLGDVPGSLRRAVEKQLERLGCEEQRALEAAAVAGMEFTAGEVAAALDEDIEAIDARCTALAQRQQLVRALGPCEWPDGVTTGRYGFTHALYLEILADRVPVSRRRRLHQRIGDRLEAAYGRQAPEIAASLAVHFARSEDSVRAAQYLRQAGEHAMRRNAFTEAIAHFRAAMQALARTVDRETRARDELQLQIALGAALSQVEGFAAPAVGEAYARALALAEQIGDVPERFAVVSGLEAFYAIRGDLPTSTVLARQLLQLGEESGDRGRIMEGHHAMGCNRLRAMELAAAQAHLEQAIALYDLEPRFDAHRLTGHDPKVCCLGHLACVLWLGGFPARARVCGETAVGRARELSHPPTLGLALTCAAWLYVLERDPRRVEELADEALAVAGDHGLTFWMPIASVQRGWALAELSRDAEVAALLQAGLVGYCAMGAGTHEVSYRTLAVQAYARIGRDDDAGREIDAAFDAMERHGERIFEAELWRLKGELLLRGHGAADSGSPDADGEAERCFQRAMGVAREQHARSFALHAAVSFCRLLGRGERRAEGQAMLRAVRRGFTEGFDTPALLEAAALLDDAGPEPS